MKRELRCRHYGRYVDDFYIVSADRDWLRSLQQPIAVFLSTVLGLSVNEGKTRICNVRQGVEFLGAYLKPHRRHVSCSTLQRLSAKIPQLAKLESRDAFRNSVNSFLGLLGHYKSYHIRCRLFGRLPRVYEIGYYQRGMRKFVLYPKSEVTDLIQNPTPPIPNSLAGANINFAPAKLIVYSD